jgi:hypothetical protein
MTNKSYCYQEMPGTHPEKHGIRELTYNDEHRGFPTLGGFIWFGADLDFCNELIEWVDALAFNEWLEEKKGEDKAWAETLIKHMPSSPVLNFESVVSGPTYGDAGECQPATIEDVPEWLASQRDFQAYVDGI